MLKAATGFRPNVKQEIIILEWGSLRRAGHGLKHRNRSSDHFLQVIYKFRKVLAAFDVVNDHMIGGSEDFEVFLGEIGNLERGVGKPVVIGGAEGVVGSVFHTR